MGPFTAPKDVPAVIWRAGIDLHPLDINKAEDVRWLEALIWPEHTERDDRLRNAIRFAQQDPPLLVAGDLNTGLAALAAEAPKDATLVVFHSAVLTYLSPEHRERFVDQVGNLPGRWISHEGPDVLPDIAAQIPRGGAEVRNRFLVDLDGRPVGWSGPHGHSVELF